MKKRRMMTIAVSCMMMLAVCVDAPAKVKKTVERGMTKEEVTAILGNPKLMSFDSFGDRWQYESQNILTGDIKHTNVMFDRSGRVVGLDTYIEELKRNNGNNSNCQHPAPQPVQPAPPVRPVPPAYNSCMHVGYSYCLDDASFSKFYNKVRNATFDNEKFDLIEVASLGCWYSCAQTARMMRLFTFDDDRMKVLRLMASRIVDPQNSADIYRLFDFESEKAKVGEILRGALK